MIQVVRKNLVNLPGFRTTRKIVVIESDDWGSIRIPTADTLKIFRENGLPVERFHYFAKNDTLEGNEDLHELFKTLRMFKDKNGNHPCITANALVANPNFAKIKADNLEYYHYELITDTYKRYSNHDEVMMMWKEIGIKEKLLYPQYHGREHLNVKYWMKTINAGAFSERIAFDNETILGVDIPGETKQDYNYMAAFEYDDEEHKREIEDITIDGLRLFKKVFGFNSKSFVPSCGIKGNHIDLVLKRGGVEYQQAGCHYIPLGKNKYKKKDYIWGHKNKHNQLFWRRNCTFEPSSKPEYDWAEHCLKEIKIAFRWGKPAVINSHRVNYVGGINEKNRVNTLNQLKNLLKAILKNWPDAEFITSEDLGNHIENKKQA